MVIDTFVKLCKLAVDCMPLYCYCNLQVKIADVQLRGMPEALLPGQPHCATASVVIAESICSLLRTLHANKSWNSTISSAIIDRLQHVDSLANLLSNHCHDRPSEEPDKSPAGHVIALADSSDKADTVSDDIIETVGEKDALSGKFIKLITLCHSCLFKWQA